MRPIGHSEQPQPKPQAERKLRPETLAPYFTLVALIHLGSIATRFDTLAAKLPAAVAPGLMLVQFPLLLLSGYFEGRLDYGEKLNDFPLWMRIRSRPVKLAFTFAFIYVCLIPLQTWNVSIGPLDPTPPIEWPQQQRAMWFAMFSVGMFFPFYLAATSGLIPLLRFLTLPFRKLPPILGGLFALALGGAIGVVVLAATTSTAITDFIKTVKDQIAAEPAISIAIIAVTTFGPLLIGLFRRDPDK